MNSAFLYASRLSNKRDKGPIDKTQIFDPKHEVDQKIKLLRDDLRDSKYAVVHTGAGVSTASGISDFRGPSGIWTMEKLYNKKVAVNTDCTLRGKGFQVQYGNTLHDPVDVWLALPSKTHLITAKLVECGIIKHIITQNVDNLHNCSKLKFSQVSELHGNLFIEACEICGARFMRAFVIPSISFMPSGHFCGLCSFPPVSVCTDVVLDWFDSYDPLYEEQAISFSKIADFHLCLGSSLTIQPACEYPSLNHHRKRDSKLYIVNYQETTLDLEADAAIHDDVNYVVSQIVSKNLVTSPPPIESVKRFKRAAAQRAALKMEMISRYGEFAPCGRDSHAPPVLAIGPDSIREPKAEEGSEQSEPTEVHPEERERRQDTDIKREEDTLKSDQLLKTKEEGVKDEPPSFLLDDSELYCDRRINLTILRLPINIPSDLYYNEYLPILKKQEQPDPIYPSMEWIFTPRVESKINEQVFLVKCSAITSIEGAAAANMDIQRGLWRIILTKDGEIRLKMWYDTAMSLKLMYNPKSNTIEGNVLACVIAYADGNLKPSVIKCGKKASLSTHILKVTEYNLSHNGHIADRDDKPLVELVATLYSDSSLSNGLSPFKQRRSFQYLYNAFTEICGMYKITGANLPPPTNHNMSSQPFFRLILKTFKDLNTAKSLESDISNINIKYFPVIEVNENYLGELVGDEDVKNVFGKPFKVPPKKRRFTNMCFVRLSTDMVTRFEHLIIEYVYSFLNNSIGEYEDQLLGEIIGRIPLWTLNYLTDIMECR